MSGRARAALAARAGAPHAAVGLLGARAAGLGALAGAHDARPVAAVAVRHARHARGLAALAAGAAAHGVGEGAHDVARAAVVHVAAQAGARATAAGLAGAARCPAATAVAGIRPQVDAGAVAGTIARVAGEAALALASASLNSACTSADRSNSTMFAPTEASRNASRPRPAVASTTVGIRSFRKPAACFHGGAFFEAIGAKFDSLERCREIINADVLDAWFPPSPKVLGALQEHLPWL